MGQQNRKWAQGGGAAQMKQAAPHSSCCVRIHPHPHPSVAAPLTWKQSPGLISGVQPTTPRVPLATSVITLPAGSQMSQCRASSCTVSVLGSGVMGRAQA